MSARSSRAASAASTTANSGDPLLERLFDTDHRPDTGTGDADAQSAPQHTETANAEPASITLSAAMLTAMGEQGVVLILARPDAIQIVRRGDA